MIGTAVTRLKVQVTTLLSCTKIVGKSLNWEYGTPMTVLLMVLWCWLCLYAELWIIPLSVVVIFTYTWITNHHSSEESIEAYRTEYIDNDGDSSEDEEAEEDEDGGDAPSDGLRKKIAKYLLLAAMVQNNTAKLASVYLSPHPLTRMGGGGLIWCLLVARKSHTTITAYFAVS
jgi:uncharacterized membrane protein